MIKKSKLKAGEKLLAEFILQYQDTRKKYEEQISDMAKALHDVAPEAYKDVVFDETWANKRLKRNPLVFWRK